MAKTTKAWVPPRGIRYRTKPNRPKPFYLLWSEDGNERSMAYANESARELAARSLAEKRNDAGADVLRFDPMKWRKWLEFEKLVGAGVDPLFVAHEWLASKQGKPLATGLTVSEAFAKYVILRDGEKSWGVDSRRHAKKHLERFCAKFGDRHLYEISTDEVRSWMLDLKDDKEKKIGPHGQRDHRKNVSTFFGCALREKWGARENPVATIRPPKTEDGDPVVIPLRDAFEYFKVNRAAFFSQ